MAGTVDDFQVKQKSFQEELKILREIILSAGLKETVKWGMPVYVSEGKNIVGMGAFKSYFGVWFFQGALLKDPQGLLINAQDGKTKALRQLRFQQKSDIKPKIVLDFIKEAVRNQKAGLVIKADKHKPLIIPELLQIKLNENKALEKSFRDLSLTQQREFVEYISEAKRLETKQSRLEKIIPLIERQVGLNDRYRK